MAPVSLAAHRGEISQEVVCIIVQYVAIEWSIQKRLRASNYEDEEGEDANDDDDDDDYTANAGGGGGRWWPARGLESQASGEHAHTLYESLELTDA